VGTCDLRSVLFPVLVRSSWICVIHASSSRPDLAPDESTTFVAAQSLNCWKLQLSYYSPQENQVHVCFEHILIQIGPVFIVTTLKMYY
jgi:hypothetical protein